MLNFDAAVIGGGILGCFAARSLSRWKKNTVLIEAAEDVCTGITRANAAVIYAGYDHAPGSEKATFTLKANADMDALCEALEVPFTRCGGLMTATCTSGERLLRKKYEQGQSKGVPGLKLLSGNEAREREPMLPLNVAAALYSPTTGTLNPWQLGIAAFENAVANGVSPMLNSAVLAIERHDGGYVIKTGREEIFTKVILNCAGLYAPQVQEMLFEPRYRLYNDASDFYVFNKYAPAPKHVIFQETEHGKGITAVPTVEGNLLLASPARALTGEYFSTTEEGLSCLRELAGEILPGLDWSQVIRNFGAVRPNPRRVAFRDGQWQPEKDNLKSFVIDAPEAGFISLIGVKTPGLTCADQLGTHIAVKAAEYLGAELNHSFNPKRRAIVRNPDCGDIICRCENVTRHEAIEAIRRGAVTVEGIKRRVGTGMGACQGSRCAWELEKLLREYGHETC